MHVSGSRVMSKPAPLFIMDRAPSGFMGSWIFLSISGPSRHVQPFVPAPRPGHREDPCPPIGKWGRWGNSAWKQRCARSPSCMGQDGLTQHACAAAARQAGLIVRLGKVLEVQHDADYAAHEAHMHLWLWPMQVPSYLRAWSLSLVRRCSSRSASQPSSTRTWTWCSGKTVHEQMNTSNEQM